MLFLIYGGKGWIGKQFIDLVKKKKIQYRLGKERVNNKNKVATHNIINMIDTGLEINDNP